MESEQNMAVDTEDAPWLQARRLQRTIRGGTLATLSKGQPFASLISPGTAHDGAVLMLLSGLAEHTRHLRADPRCSLLIAGAPQTANPQTAPRLTITGLAEPIDDPALKARWLALHPYAQLYAGFGDFGLWRLQPAAAMLVGGFARAFRLKIAEFLPDPAVAATIAAAEGEVVAHCNADHADAMAAIGAAASGTAGPWRMVGADSDGCDLACEERVVRAQWRAPVDSVDVLRTELIRLARAAREA